MTDSGSHPEVPPETDAAIAGWMGSQGWKVGPARWEQDPGIGFHVWQEEKPIATSHALWVSETMVSRLSAEQLLEVLDGEDMAQELRISLRVRIQERGDGYRILVVPRHSGEWRSPEQ